MKNAVVLLAVCVGFLHTDVFSRHLHKCRYQAHVTEVEHGLPKFILSAISFTESSESPWVLNVQGTPYRFKTKTAAVLKAKSLIKEGVTNFDLGCMQVNYGYHGHNFRSVEDMLDPRQNMRYAANFIKQMYEETNSWKKAVAYYHSRADKIGSRYSDLVHSKWEDMKILYGKKFPTGYFLEKPVAAKAAHYDTKNMEKFLKAKEVYYAFVAANRKWQKKQALTKYRNTSLSMNKT